MPGNIFHHCCVASKDGFGIQKLPLFGPPSNIPQTDGLKHKNGVVIIDYNDLHSGASGTQTDPHTVGSSSLATGTATEGDSYRSEGFGTPKQETSSMST